MQNSRALNIKYGSFALSLEGYDEPFELVKQVTDLYADISQHHPSFGATPVAASYGAPSVSTPDPTPPSPDDPKPNTDPNIWGTPKSEPDLLVLDKALPAYSRTDDMQVLASSKPLEVVELVTSQDDESATVAGNKGTNILAPKYPFRRFPNNPKQ